MSTDSPYVYDKAKYHLESIDEFGLPEEHAYHHTTFFLSWLVNNGLMSEWFLSESAKELALYRSGQMSINELYESWDACLISDMLSDEGNAFALDYFDFERGDYLADYAENLQKDLPSEFHVPYTPDTEAIAHAMISERYAQWLGTRSH